MYTINCCSTGIYIKNARGNSNFTYKMYLEKIEEISESLEKDAQKYDIASGGYPYSTTISAVAHAARKLASDKWLEKVGQYGVHMHICTTYRIFQCKCPLAPALQHPQILRVAGCMEEVLEWFNYPHANVYPD